MIAKLIRTEQDYEAALTRLDHIFDAKPGTPEAEEVELLGLLITHYEDAHFPIDLPDPIAAIQFRMDQLGMKPKDLAKVVGYKSRVSEIFSRKRKLSLAMIRKIHAELRIPVEVLVREY